MTTPSEQAGDRVRAEGKRARASLIVRALAMLALPVAIILFFSGDSNGVRTIAIAVAIGLVIGGIIGVPLWKRRTRMEHAAQQRSAEAIAHGALFAHPARPSFTQEVELTGVAFPTEKRTTAIDIVRNMRVGVLAVDHDRVRYSDENVTRDIPLAEMRSVMVRGQRKHPVWIIDGGSEAPLAVSLFRSNDAADDHLAAAFAQAGVQLIDGRG